LRMYHGVYFSMEMIGLILLAFSLNPELVY
jgi:hypothetical protein